MNINGLKTTNDSGIRLVADAHITPKVETDLKNGVGEANTRGSVFISESARAAQKLDLGHAIRQQQEKLTKVTEESNAEKKSLIDEQIERIKERIEELKQELKDLSRDRSDAADKQREMINAEIMQLTAMLVDLYNEKAKNEGAE